MAVSQIVNTTTVKLFTSLPPFMRCPVYFFVQPYTHHLHSAKQRHPAFPACTASRPQIDTRSLAKGGPLRLVYLPPFTHTSLLQPPKPPPAKKEICVRVCIWGGLRAQMAGHLKVNPLHRSSFTICINCINIQPPFSDIMSHIASLENTFFNARENCFL